MVRLGLAAAAAWSAPALAPLVPAVSDALGVARRLPSGTRGVALTFDDGPHAEGTPALLDLLGESGTRGTFFLVGEQVERLPRVAERIAREGHAVALHGYRHRNLLRVPPRALARDLERGAGAIENATGVAPALYRPPAGGARAHRRRPPAPRRRGPARHPGSSARRASPSPAAVGTRRCSGRAGVTTGAASPPRIASQTR